MFGSATPTLHETPPALPPEAELLLCCARVALDPAGARRAGALVAEGIDWPAVIRVAQEQRVLPLLYASACAIASHAIPASALETMRVDCVAIAGKNLRLSAALVRLLALFERSGIPVIPFKGPLLAVSLYGGIGARPFSDLDLLVRERDVPRAMDLLSAEGYLRGWSDADWEHHFEDPAGQVGVDLQHRLVPRYLPVPVTFEEIWKSRRPVAFSSTTAFTLAPEHLLLSLGLELAKDCLDRRPRLLHVCDVAELVRTHPDLAWEFVLERARAAGGERMLLMGLELARSLLGTALPPVVLSSVRRDPAVGPLARAVAPQFLRDSAGLPDSRGPDSGFYFRARERLADKPRYAWYRAVHPLRLLVTPTDKDRRFVELPSTLDSLYYLIRPIRVARDRLARRARRRGR